MSDGHAVFRFEIFADASSAQAAFEAMYPPGSPVEPAVQALADLGAQCKMVGNTRIACRYVENERALAGWCWHVALDSDAARKIQRSSVSLSILAV